MDLFLALLFLIGVGIAAVTAILVGTFSNLGESIIAAWRDHLGYRHTERMARMEMRQRSRPVRVIVIQGDTVYITRGERRQSLPPAQAKRVLEHALMLRQPAEFVEQAERWIVRNANVAQLPSADRHVTVRK